MIVQQLKKYLLYAILIGSSWFLMYHHIIIYGASFNFIDNFKTLKKAIPTLQYTFFFIEDKNNDSIFATDQMRRDGIGEVLVEIGRITEEQRWSFENKYYNDEKGY